MATKDDGTGGLKTGRTDPQPLESAESLSPLHDAPRRSWDERLAWPSVHVAQGRGEVVAATVVGAAVAFALTLGGSGYLLFRWWSKTPIAAQATEEPDDPRRASEVCSAAPADSSITASEPIRREGAAEEAHWIEPTTPAPRSVGATCDERRGNPATLGVTTGEPVPDRSTGAR